MEALTAVLKQQGSEAEFKPWGSILDTSGPDHQARRPLPLPLTAGSDAGRAYPVGEVQSSDAGGLMTAGPAQHVQSNSAHAHSDLQ